MRRRWWGGGRGVGEGVVGCGWGRGLRRWGGTRGGDGGDA